MDKDEPTRRRRLSKMLGLGDEPDELWKLEDLGAIYRHQMAAPVVVDLAGVDKMLDEKLHLLADAHGLLLKSFHDLFVHSAPPIELLVLTKDFAKANRLKPQSVLPLEVANVLYYASIAAALVRCGRAISKLSGTDLIGGLGWAAEQPWVDEPIRRLLNEAQGLVKQEQVP